MKKVRVAKMTYRSNHFNLNQKVWLLSMSGSQAAKVVGKFRGSGRYVTAWIKWGTDDKAFPEFKEIEVAIDFAKKYGI